MARSMLAGLVLGVAVAAPGAARAEVPVDTLLANGSFAADAQLDGWDLGTAVASWSTLDVAGDPTSGSARIENSFLDPGFSFEISQCLVTGPGPHAFGASYWIASGQEPATGDAGVRWFFSAGSSCDPGAILAGGQRYTENIVIVPDVWGEVSIADVAAPPGTGSVKFSLANRQESGLGIFVVQFDDAYAVVPEPRGLAGACAAALALAALRLRRRAPGPARAPGMRRAQPTRPERPGFRAHLR